MSDKPSPLKISKRELFEELKIHFVFCFLQLKDLDCEGLFGNIESILETSKKLLNSLENAIRDKEGKDQELGNVWQCAYIHVHNLHVHVDTIAMHFYQKTPYPLHHLSNVDSILCLYTE